MEIGYKTYKKIVESLAVVQFIELAVFWLAVYTTIIILGGLLSFDGSYVNYGLGWFFGGLMLVPTGMFWIASCATLQWIIDDIIL